MAAPTAAVASRFGQRLAHTEKKHRDAALKKLTAYLSRKRAWTPLEWDKLWKALFYCFWMSDKRPVQLELARSLARLVHALPARSEALAFVRSFLRTMRREWHGLDGLRLDKFYDLVRQFVRESVALLAAHRFPRAGVSELADMLSAEVVSQRPNGLRMHLSDLFLAEVHAAAGEQIPTGAFLLLLEPFFTLLGSEYDQSVFKRVRDLVFLPMLSEYAFGDAAKAAEEEKEKAKSEKSESKAKGDDETDGDDDDDAVRGFPRVDLARVQHRIFAIAAAEETAERNRAALYDLYGKFAAVTKVDSLQAAQEEALDPTEEDEDEAADEDAEMEETAPAPEDQETQQQKKKKKKKSKKRKQMDVAGEVEKEEEKEKEAPVKKAKKTVETQEEEQAKKQEKQQEQKKKKARKQAEEAVKTPADTKMKRLENDERASSGDAPVEATTTATTTKKKKKAKKSADADADATTERATKAAKPVEKKPKSKKETAEKKPSTEATSIEKKAKSKKETVEKKPSAVDTSIEKKTKSKKETDEKKKPVVVVKNGVKLQRCTSCGGFGKNLVRAGKDVCGHCERTRKTQKKAAKKRKAADAEGSAAAEEAAGAGKKVTFGKNKALPHSLSVKRLKASAKKDAVPKDADLKGVLKAPSASAPVQATAKKGKKPPRKAAADFF